MMSHLTSGYELTFKDICIEIEKKEILKHINGLAHPGEMLAVMGPSGKLDSWQHIIQSKTLVGKGFKAAGTIIVAVIAT